MLKFVFAPQCLLVSALLGTTLLVAQAPPPTYTSPTSLSGSISQLNYGPDLQANGFILNNNTIVTLPPEAGGFLAAYLKPGGAVQLQGYLSTTATGLQRLDLISFTDTASGRTFTIPQPGQFTAYSGTGTVTQFNFNREGEVDGFFLNNGVFAKTPPPYGATLRSTVSLGSTVSIAGNAHQVLTGQTVVDVQTLNGQTIAPAAPAGPPAGPARGGAPPIP